MTWNQYETEELCIKFANKFDTWWDVDKFDWFLSCYLFRYLPHKFNTWWDPNEFKWYWNSNCLPKYLPHKFNTWWNPDRFDWRYIDDLFEFLLNKIVVWYKIEFVNIYDIITYINKLGWDYE